MQHQKETTEELTPAHMIAREILYLPVTNNQHIQSIEYGRGLIQAYSSQQNKALMEENARLKYAVMKMSDIGVKLASENINNLPFIKDEAFKCVSIAIEALKPKQ